MKFSWRCLRLLGERRCKTRNPLSRLDDRFEQFAFLELTFTCNLSTVAIDSCERTIGGVAALLAECSATDQRASKHYRFVGRLRQHLNGTNTSVAGRLRFRWLAKRLRWDFLSKGVFARLCPQGIGSTHSNLVVELERHGTVRCRSSSTQCSSNH